MSATPPSIVYCPVQCINCGNLVQKVFKERWCRSCVMVDIDVLEYTRMCFKRYASKKVECNGYK